MSSSSPSQQDRASLSSPRPHSFLDPHCPYDPSRLGKYRIIRDNLVDTLYGRISLAKDSATDAMVAIKISDLGAASRRVHVRSGVSLSEDIVQEVRVHHELSMAIGTTPRSRILRLVDVWRDDKSLYMVTPFFYNKKSPHTGRDLLHFVNTRPVMSSREARRELPHGVSQNEFEAQRCIRQLAEALVFLQGHGYVHRDVSLENIIVDSELNVYLMDFGTVAAVSDEGSWVAPAGGGPGKLLYKDPRILRGMAYDMRDADVWSAGVALFILLFHQYPWQAGPLDGQLMFEMIREGRLREHLRRIGATCGEPALDLLDRMWREPEYRISAQEMLEHPFLSTAPNA